MRIRRPFASHQPEEPIRIGDEIRAHQEEIHLEALSQSVSSHRPHPHGFGRREFLKSLGLGALGLTGIAPAAPKPPKADRALRIAFLSDVHLPASGKNDEFARVLRIAQGPDIRPDIILFGGDNVFALDNATPGEAKAQLDNWRLMLRENAKVPTYTCLGNHDLQGIGLRNVGNLDDSKEAAANAFGMPHRYYSFDRGGWRFLVLDTIQPRPASYVGQIDAEQVQWLEDNLESRRVPTVVLGHIPIVSITGAVSAAAGWTPGYTRLSHRHQVTNSREISDIFRRNPHARLALSGHTHMVDHVRFRNTHFVCGGSVSGAWWRGSHEHFPATFFVIDLFTDGGIRAFPISWQNPR